MNILTQHCFKKNGWLFLRWFIILILASDRWQGELDTRNTCCHHASIFDPRRRSHELVSITNLVSELLSQESGPNLKQSCEHCLSQKILKIDLGATRERGRLPFSALASLHHVSWSQIISLHISAYNISSFSPKRKLLWEARLLVAVGRENMSDLRSHHPFAFHSSVGAWPSCSFLKSWTSTFFLDN